MLITSSENRKIKLYKKLVSYKKVREDQRLFTIEGTRLFADAVKENADIVYALVTEKALENNKELLSAVSDRLDCVSEPLAESISATKSPQGVFAVAGQLSHSAPKRLEKGRYLVLDGVQDPGNLGTALRTADAVGLRGVFLCGGCCELYNPKVVRSTMGSLFRVPVYKNDSLAQTVEILKKSGIESYAAVIDKTAQDLKEISFGESCAVVIGNEGSGLSKSDVSLCDRRLTISMQGNIDSLNAATACGIILWEMTKD